jgi:phage tail tape-measure protein
MRTEHRFFYPVDGREAAAMRAGAGLRSCSTRVFREGEAIGASTGRSRLLDIFPKSSARVAPTEVSSSLDDATAAFSVEAEAQPKYFNGRRIGLT